MSLPYGRGSVSRYGAAHVSKRCSMSSDAVKLAIFGGTFDPIHEGHLAVAREAAARFQLDRILFVPAAHPPHKAGVTHAPYEDRVRMVELACGEDARFELSR